MQHLHDGRESCSLQCRRILGGRNLVRVRNIVVVAIFDFMTVHGRLGRAEIVTLTVGARAKEGKGEGEGRKKIRRFLFSLPAPSLFPLTRPFPHLFGKFQHGAFASKLRAQRKRLHYRL